MQALKILTGSLILAGVGAAQQGNAILFEGALLIVGDGSAAIENSAFLVENNKFSRIGKKGDIRPPAGAARVDLTGKTVMPALIDAHTHLGWEIVKTGQMGADSYTRANLIDHLQRYAYYGIAAAQSMGIDPGETPYQVRADPGPQRCAISHRRPRNRHAERRPGESLLETRGLWREHRSSYTRSFAIDGLTPRARMGLRYAKISVRSS